MEQTNNSVYKAVVLKQLQTIPGVGKACALDLWNIGIRQVADLKNQNPWRLYNQLNRVTGQTHDVCMLYTFRCAVYYASENQHDPEKLKWWNWKNRPYRETPNEL